jgi:hypothetical protein
MTNVIKIFVNPDNWSTVGYWNFEREEYLKTIEEYSKCIELSNHKNYSPWDYYWRGRANKKLGYLEDSLNDITMFYRISF